MGDDRKVGGAGLGRGGRGGGGRLACSWQGGARGVSGQEKGGEREHSLGGIRGQDQVWGEVRGQGREGGGTGWHKGATT